MSRNNSVTSVLVTEGGSGPLEGGSTVDALAPGQIGVFDAQTGLSLDELSSPAREIFLAVGLDRDNDTVLDDIVTSAGQVIQTKNLKAFNFREHTAARPLVGVIGGYKGECDTDYAVKIEFRNQQIYRTQGFNQFTKTFAFRTACCDDCDVCPSGDANEVSVKMLEAINADADGLLTAQIVARQDITSLDVDAVATVPMETEDPTAGTPLTAVDVQALIEFNEAQADETTKLFTDVEITSVPLAINKYCGVNLKYFHPRGTDVLVSMVEGFGCAGSFTVTQELAFEEGNGYDIAQKEFHAAGNQQNKPYAVSESTNTAIDFDSFADKNTKYDQFTLEYDQESEGGWLEYKNNLRTVIAIPNEDVAATSQILNAILEVQFQGAALGFGSIQDAVDNADPVDTNVDSTSDIDDEEADGIA